MVGCGAWTGKSVDTVAFDVRMSTLGVHRAVNHAGRMVTQLNDQRVITLEEARSARDGVETSLNAIRLAQTLAREVPGAVVCVADEAAWDGGPCGEACTAAGGVCSPALDLASQIITQTSDVLLQEMIRYQRIGVQ